MTDQISVCIPAYNEENLIKRCLESVSSQKGVEISEILVGINSSTDRTKEIVEKYAEIDPRVRVVDSPKGKANAWNALNAAAKNNLRIFQDGDCIALPGSYLQLLNLLQDNFIVGSSVKRDVKGKSLWVKILHFPEKYVSPVPILNGNLYLMNYALVLAAIKANTGKLVMDSDIINDDLFLKAICEKVFVSRNVFVQISVADTINQEIRRYKRMKLGCSQLEKRYPLLQPRFGSKTNIFLQVKNYFYLFYIAGILEKILYFFITPIKSVLFRYIHYQVMFRDLEKKDVAWK